ncbi:MAG: hypothetical protein Q7J72_05280 [Candidatus Omnitrophota bacterium]|nr:hypothetical protein [Candidatus Omnitrophota bacterium]
MKNKALVQKQFDKIFEYFKEDVFTGQTDRKKMEKIAKLVADNINNNYKQLIFFLLLKLAKIDKKIDEYFEFIGVSSAANAYCIVKKLGLNNKETKEIFADMQTETKWGIEKIRKEKKEIRELVKMFSLRLRRKK